MVIGPLDEDGDVPGSERDGGGCTDDQAADALPASPGAGAEVAAPERAVGTTDEQVDRSAGRRNRGRIGGRCFTPKGFPDPPPTAHCDAVPVIDQPTGAR